MPVLREPASPYTENHSPEHCLFSHLEGASCPLGHSHHHHHDHDHHSAAMPDHASRPAKGACRRCHDRKVKCDIATTGKPCTSCRKDSITCEPRTRKQYYSEKRQRHHRSVPPSSSYPRSSSNTPDVNNHYHPHYPPRTQTPSRANGVVTSYSSVSSPPHFTTLGESSTTQAYPDPTFSDHRHLLEQPRLPSYTGDQTGLGYILDAAGLKSQHVTITPSMAQNLDRDELHFLSQKGVFSIPSTPVCDELIQCYFRHLHPTMPVVDSFDFIEKYERDGIQGSNLLLLWSIFHVGASYISDQGLAMTGHVSRRDFKSTCFSRAKYLSDMRVEPDPTVLIQSALLLSLWDSGPEDEFQSWNWVGTAVNVAQVLGLHRNPDTAQPRRNNSLPRRNLWRRLFWTCFYRDRWIALHMSRPLRINLADCDVPFPEEEDVLAELNSLTQQMRVKYHLTAPPAQYWVNLIRLSVHLGDVLASNYRPSTRPLPYSAIERLAVEIQNCVPAENEGYQNSDSSLQADQVALHREAALITLFRKGAFKPGTEAEDTSLNSSARASCRSKIKIAAVTFNSIMENIIARSDVSLLSPLTIPLCVPAMQTHLMEAKMNSSLLRTSDLSRLDFWVTFLEGLDHNFPFAGHISKIFHDARENTFQPSRRTFRSRSPSSTTNPTIPPQSTENTQTPYSMPVLASNAWDEAMFLESWSNLNWQSTPESVENLEGGSTSGRSSRGGTRERR